MTIAKDKIYLDFWLGSPQSLYDEMYCARGDMEKPDQEKQLDLFADRTSCHRFWPNQFRALLSALAYVLMRRSAAWDFIEQNLPALNAVPFV